MANQRNGTLYTGVRSDLPRRLFEHQNSIVLGSTLRYDYKLLVWCEEHPTMPDAISRETQIKGGSRKAKLRLIETSNPSWSDFAQSLA